MKLLILLAQLNAPQAVAKLPVNQSTAAEYHVYLDSLTEVFLREERFAWELSQIERRPAHANDSEWASGDTKNRGFSLHCHFAGGPLQIRSHLIKGETPSHASCPRWYPADLPPVADERRSLDNGLTDVLRLRIGQLRVNLRRVLDTAAMQLPDDVEILRDRVRFALDSDDLPGAVGVVASCTHEVIECGLLQGLVLYRAGLAAAADSAFLATAAMMRDDDRCRWNDVAVLLEPDERYAYKKQSCTARADVEARMWWLADPLYLEPGNERRAEHFARKVYISLISPRGRDFRQHFEPRFGGEAVTETLLRYGWPTHLYWGGGNIDRGHNGWLLGVVVDTASPYVLREYTRDRVHTLPANSVLTSPFKATPADWQLNGLAEDDGWWPVEHYARDASALVQLPVGQAVMLRRRGMTRFVWAGDLDSAALHRRAGDSVRATLFESRSIGTVTRVDTYSAQAGGRLLVDTPLEPGPVLLAIELPGDSARAAARTRFGTEVLEPLVAAVRSRSLSQPLLFNPAASNTGTLHADSAVSRMLGATTMSAERRLGVYWESYGFPPADTVDIEIQLNREDAPGVLSRIAGALRLGGRDDVRIGLRWRETPGSSSAIQAMEAGVPVQMRSTVLDLTHLPHGRYVMRISTSVPHGTPVVGERVFVLR